jgi:hypothetical protein
MPPSIDEKVVYKGDEFIVEEVDNVRITRVLIKVNHQLSEEHEELEELKENSTEFIRTEPEKNDKEIS